jgi:hypothetical protein
VPISRISSFSSGAACVPEIGFSHLPADVAARAAALLRFAEEAFAAFAEREPDPIEEVERAAVFGGGDGGSRHGVAVSEENFAGKGITQ